MADEDGDLNGPDQSFWTFLQRTRKYSFDEQDDKKIERITKRQRRVCRQGYGVSYQWITVADCWSGRWGYEWNYSDGYFQGATLEDFNRVLEQFPKKDIKNESDEDVNGDASVRCRPYKAAGQETICIPDRCFSKNSSSLPTPQEMAGEYDIIYYGGDLREFFSCHNRTARGTLQLSSSVNEDRTTVISGTVAMHPCMNEIDVIPFGGNYKFVETARFQRQGRNKEDDFPGDPTLPTGVISVKVTDPPDGACVRTAWSRSDNDLVFKGEMRIFREKTGAGITDQHPPDPCSGDILTSKYDFDCTKEAEELNKAHYANTCSWLHKHTILNQSCASKVGEFVSPPPVFFFMKGDIQIDIDWDGIVGGHLTTSCIIARPRASNNTHSPGPGLLVSNESKYEKEMRVVQSDIEKLERKKDMIWLAYKCSELIRGNDVEAPWVFFPLENEKVRRCVLFMDVNLFNQQLSLYGLHLERQQEVQFGYRFYFSRPDG